MSSSWSSRSNYQQVPVDQPHELPSDLPVPSTSRSLHPRSRATSLSAANSRPSSRSGDTRLYEMPGPSTQTNFDWYDNSQTMESFFDYPTPSAPLPEYNMSSEPPHMDFQNYSRNFDPEWNVFGHDLSAQEAFSFTNDPSPNRRKRKRNDADDSDMILPYDPEGSGVPFDQGLQQGETSAAGASRRGVQRKKFNVHLSSNNPHINLDHDDSSTLTTDERHQDVLMGSSSGSSSQENSTTDRKGKGKAKAEPSGSPIIVDLSDSPPTKSAGKTAKKPPNEPLSAYTCPICFSPPTNATLTPCGHICCGACLFAALKATMQRAASTAPGGVAEARCPICRAIIPGWDGKGGGVIGLKARAIFRL